MHAVWISLNAWESRPRITSILGQVPAFRITSGELVLRAIVALAALFDASKLCLRLTTGRFHMQPFPQTELPTIRSPCIRRSGSIAERLDEVIVLDLHDVGVVMYAVLIKFFYE